MGHCEYTFHAIAWLDCTSMRIISMIETSKTCCSIRCCAEYCCSQRWQSRCVNCLHQWIFLSFVLLRQTVHMVATGAWSPWTPWNLWMSFSRPGQPWRFSVGIQTLWIPYYVFFAWSLWILFKLRSVFLVVSGPRKPCLSKQTRSGKSMRGPHCDNCLLRYAGITSSVVCRWHLLGSLIILYTICSCYR